MLKKCYLFNLLMLICMGSLAADYNFFQGQGRLFGEYLYFAPSIDDSYFVIESPVTTTFPNGKRRNNDCHFNSGYRVGAAYDLCDCNAEVLAAYTHFGMNRSKTVNGDFLWATIGRPDLVSNFENYAGFAKSSLRFNYQRLDALYAQQIFDCCGVKFNLAFGLEAAELKLHEKYIYSNETSVGTVHQNSRTNAIGPEFGFGVNYQLCQFTCYCPGTLSLNFLTSGSLLAADTKSKARNTLGETTLLDVSDKEACRVIPALHARVGLNYDMSFSCFDTSIEVGYEFSSYVRGLSRTIYPDDVADGLCYSRYDNFDLQGLYVSMSFRF